MNLQSNEFHKINSSNLGKLFEKFDVHYKSMRAVMATRKGLTGLAEYLKEKHEQVVYYAVVNEGRDRFEENFSLCTRGIVRIKTKNESVRPGAQQGGSLKPSGTMAVYGKFIEDIQHRLDKETVAKIDSFFRGVIEATLNGYVTQLHYHDGEFDFSAQNASLGHKFEIYFEALTT